MIALSKELNRIVIFMRRVWPASESDFSFNFVPIIVFYTSFTLKQQNSLA